MVHLDDIKPIKQLLVGELDASTKIREESAAQRLREEVTDLKARLHDAERENTSLKLKIENIEAELKETQTTLGQFVVAANRKTNLENAVAKTVTRPEPSIKRARSPSLEIIEISKPKQVQPKVENKIEIVEDHALSSEKDDTSTARSAQNVTACIESVEAPARPSCDTINSSAPSNSENDRPQTKRRRIESDQKTLEHKEEKLNLVNEALSNTDSASISSGQKLTQPPGASNPQEGTWTSICVDQTETQKANPMQNTQKSTVPINLPSPDIENFLPNEPIKTTSTTTTLSSPAKTKIKVTTKHENVFNLSVPEVQIYLESCKALPISPPPLGLEVPRAFLRIAYGGSDMQFLQYPTLNPSGERKRRMVFPMLDLNPCIPQNPGEPGLIFASRHEILSNPPWTLFIKRKNLPPAVWVYLGEYECSLCGTMSAEQFGKQSTVVQNTWAKFLLGMVQRDVYVAMRARIALRKAGKIPAEDKETQEQLVNQEMDAVKTKNRTLAVSVEDVIEAFCNGDEGIDIIQMNCIEYDHVFANDMKSKFLEYPQLLAADKDKQAKLKAKKLSTPKRISSKSAKKSHSRKISPSLSVDDDVAALISANRGPTPMSVRRSGRPRSTRLRFDDMLIEPDSRCDDDNESLYEEEKD